LKRGGTNASFTDRICYINCHQMGHLETEVKISVDPAGLLQIRSRLSELGARPLAERAKEENLLFDFPDHRLEREGYALRLRAYGEESLLTFKGKAREDSRLKEREEIETQVSDGVATRELLCSLGLGVSFRYAKYREILELFLSGEKVVFCLDETSVGAFVEIEGPEAAIDEAAALFGWGSDSFVRTNYVKLYREGAEEGGERSGSSLPCRE